MGKVPHWKSGPHEGFPGHKQQDQPKESPFQRLFTASKLINPHKTIPESFTPRLSCLLVQARHHPGIVCPETVGPGEKIQGKGNPLALNVGKKKKIKTHTHTKQVISLENMRKWVVWNHWFCPFPALVLQLASTVRKIHVLLTYTSICWVTSRPGCGSVSWGLRRSAADRKTAIWVLTCHPEPLWFPWIPPRNRILGHDMK